MFDIVCAEFVVRSLLVSSTAENTPIVCPAWEARSVFCVVCAPVVLCEVYIWYYLCSVLIRVVMQHNCVLARTHRCVLRVLRHGPVPPHRWQGTPDGGLLLPQEGGVSQCSSLSLWTPGHGLATILSFVPCAITVRTEPQPRGVVFERCVCAWCCPGRGHHKRSTDKTDSHP